MLANLTGLLPAKLQPYAKFVVAALGAVLVVASQSGLPFVHSPYFTGAVAILAALGVYQLPNKKPA